jgi:hypothetical protein
MVIISFEWNSRNESKPKIIEDVKPKLTNKPKYDKYKEYNSKKILLESIKNFTDNELKKIIIPIHCPKLSYSCQQANHLKILFLF